MANFGIFRGWLFLRWLRPLFGSNSDRFSPDGYRDRTLSAFSHSIIPHSITLSPLPTRRSGHRTTDPPHPDATGLHFVPSFLRSTTTSPLTTRRSGHRWKTHPVRTLPDCISFHHSTIPSFIHSILPSLHHSILPSLHPSFTPSLYYSTPPLLHSSITPSSPNVTSVVKNATCVLAFCCFLIVLL
nr:hypothetical protein [Bacteroidota bacterium]